MMPHYVGHTQPVREPKTVGFDPAGARSDAAADVRDAYAEGAPSPAELFLQIGVVLAVALGLAWILELAL